MFAGISVTKNSQKLLPRGLKSWRTVGYSGQIYIGNVIYVLIESQSNFRLLPLTSKSIKRNLTECWKKSFNPKPTLFSNIK